MPRFFLLRKSGPPQPNLFGPRPSASMFAEASKAKKPGSLPMEEPPATPEESVHNAVMHLSRTGDATVPNIAARLGMRHTQAIGILSRLRLAGHLLKDGEQYRLGRPLAPSQQPAKPKSAAKPAAPAPRQLNLGEVEQSVRSMGFQHTQHAAEALRHYEQHGSAGLLEQAKQARKTWEDEFKRTGTETPKARQANAEMDRATQAMTAGRLHPDVQQALTGKKSHDRG